MRKWATADENIGTVRVLELLKQAVGLWHWRHTEMIVVLPREHPVKIQGLSLCLSFSLPLMLISLPLSEVMAENFQWCPRRPRIIIQVCVCIYVCVSKRMIDLMCAQSSCICLFVHVKLMYWRVRGWPLVGLCRTLAGSSDPLLHHFSSQTGRLMWSDKHFSLSPVISSSWSIIKCKLRACETHFGHSITVTSHLKTANFARESKTVRRQALHNEINGCLWVESWWKKLCVACYAIKAIQRKIWKTAYVITTYKQPDKPPSGLAQEDAQTYQQTTIVLNNTL